MKTRKYLSAGLATGLLGLGLAVLPAAAAAEETGHHESHRNELAVFLGITHERRENGFAFGLEYERRLNEKVGVGVLAEHTWGDFNFWVYALPVTLHAGQWKFVVAPGVEESHGHTEKLARLAAGYEIDTGRARITPSLSVDFVDNEAVYVLGFSIGQGFQASMKSATAPASGSWCCRRSGSTCDSTTPVLSTATPFTSRSARRSGSPGSFGPQSLASGGHCSAPFG